MSPNTTAPPASTAASGASGSLARNARTLMTTGRMPSSTMWTAKANTTYSSTKPRVIRVNVLRCSRVRSAVALAVVDQVEYAATGGAKGAAGAAATTGWVCSVQVEPSQ